MSRCTLSSALFFYLLISSCAEQPKLDISDRGQVTAVNDTKLSVGSKSIAIVHGRVITADQGRVIEDGLIHIEAGYIAQVKPYEGEEFDGETILIDASGHSVLPGLIDAHFHRDQHYRLPATVVDRGVTSLRDPGAWIEDYDTVQKIGGSLPRLFLTGPHFDMFPPAYPKNSYILQNPHDATQAVIKFYSQGASAIKIYFRSTIPIIKATCLQADLYHIPVTGHLEITDIYEAVEAGLDGIEHITSVGYNLVPAQQAESYKQAILHDNNARRAGRYSMWDEIDPSGPAARQLAQFLAAQNIVVCPTLGAFEYRGDSTFTDTLRANAFANMLQYTHELHQAGVDVVIGSHGWVPYDDFGWAYHHEMDLFEEAGFDRADIIEAATIKNAQFLRIDDRLGSITKGKEADLVLVKGDPLVDLTHLRAVEKVILSGRVLR